MFGDFRAEFRVFERDGSDAVRDGDRDGEGNQYVDVVEFGEA